MTRKDVVNHINLALQDRVPYSGDLSRSLNRMSQEQLEYFYDHVAPYYIEKAGGNLDLVTCKEMEYMARAVEHNKDVRNILGVDYRQIGSILDQLPDLNVQTQTNAHDTSVKTERTDAERIAHINEMIDRYVLHVGESEQGVSNSTFCQSANANDVEIMPAQGWKTHISSNGLADYERLLEVLLPEFDRLGIPFKVARPEALGRLDSGQQMAKHVTLYGQIDINSYSPELMAILSEQGPSPIGDVQLEGRIHARYGKFRGSNTHDLVAVGGQVTPDPRHLKVCPDFVIETTPAQILNFASECNQRYAQTGDAKNYIQEMFLMTQSDPRYNAFVTIPITPENEADLQYVISRDSKGLSDVFKIGGQRYALIHNDHAERALSELDRRNTNYERPEWDKRYNLYEIYPDSLDEAVNCYNMWKNRFGSQDSPGFSFVQLDENTWAFKVDTVFMKTFEEESRMWGLSLKELAVGMDGHTLHQEFDMNARQQDHDVISYIIE